MTKDELIKELGDDMVEQFRADARRWRYVRDYLAQALSPHMDGTFQFHLRGPRGRGHTIDEVIDKLIAESDEPTICTHCGEARPTPHVLVLPEEAYCQQCWDKLCGSVGKPLPAIDET